jgi:O-acetyl-ADP-ribose deacetylase (regulator of RNase III)
MPFEIIRNDLTSVKADAIVNTANPEPRIGKGTDEAVYAAAGREKLLAERKKIGIIRPGEAYATPAFALSAKYIIHTAGPVWKDGFHHETEVLMDCYRNSLHLALQLHCASIAFPLISSGHDGFPKDQAVSAASSAIYSFLMKHDMEVILTVFDDESYAVTEHLFPGITSYIDEGCAGQQLHAQQRPSVMHEPLSFQDLINEQMKEKKLKPAEVYRASNLSKQTFSKLFASKKNHPSRNTVLALAIGLKCSVSEAEVLLASAGYAFIPGDPADRCIKYFLSHDKYNIVEDNIALEMNGLNTLGSKA